MNTKELIEKYEDKLKDVQLKFGASFKTKVYEGVIESLKQLDEPQKPVVPQFVADWYEENKDDFDFNVWDWIVFKNEPKKLENKEFNDWFNGYGDNPIQTLVNMRQFGYEVEKEKRYRVKFKGMRGDCDYLNYGVSAREWFMCSRFNFENVRTHFTHKELEDAGFGWVFDCEGIEVEEVK